MELIKREDAIRGKQAQTLNANAEFMMGRFCNEDEIRIYNIGFAEGWNAHIERCKDIPTAEPKQGEWLFKEITDDYHITGLCSVCKERRRIDNFCPNCGCRMEGADDED